MESASEVHEIQSEDAAKPFDFATLLRPLDRPCGKPLAYVDGVPRLFDDIEKERAKAEGRKVEKRAHPTWHSARSVAFGSLEQLVSILSKSRGEFLINERVADGVNRNRLRRLSKNFDAQKHRLIMIDCDATGVAEPDGATVAALMRDQLPEPFHGVRCGWNATASHMIGASGKAKVRLFFLANRAVNSGQVETWLAPHHDIADPAIYHERQAIYLAPGAIKGGPDPFAGKRWGIVEGERQLVEIPADLPPRKKADRGIWAAPENVKIDDPEMLAFAIPIALRRRTVARIEADKRRNTIRKIGYDFKDFGFSRATATAIILCWFCADAESADDLRDVLEACGVNDATTLAGAVRAAGAKVFDTMAEGEEIDDSDVLRQIDDAYRSVDRPFGCITIDMLRADEAKGKSDGSEYGAVDLDDEDNAPGESALDLWLAEPSDLERYERLVSDLASRGIKRSAASRAVRDAQLGALMGVNEEAGVVALRELATAPKSKAAKAFALRPFDIADFKSIPPRRFIFGHDYIRKFVSATTSPGGRGKSNLTIAEACCMACGMDFSGEPARRIRVLLWNGEDPREEIELRVAAWLQHHSKTQADLGGRLTILSGRDCAVKLVEQSARGPIVSADAVARFEATVEAGRFDVVTLDPAIKFMRGGENSNESADLLVSTLADVADKRDAAMMLVNHARKPSKDGDGTTTLADSRGASALTDAARAQRVLNAMSKAEATAWSIDPDESWRYVRVGGPGARKANLAPGGAATWFEQRSEIVENGRDGYGDSSVGVAVAWTPPGGPGCGTDKQEAVAEWLAKKGAGELIPVKDAAVGIGTESKDFWRNVMRGTDRVPTSRGFLEYVKHLGAKGSLVRLVKLEPEFAPADESESDN